ncbi:hypothetical protein KC19_2G064800 [Ceratodon purpureus]|uniref:XRCC4 N-terminal domain-containing protein n=1 Tax=Ceratodon purpureus TaxID=3225 RepID=A0A8T0ITW7_CERPU|nr:hypothetical protein KC19_2G064800 [Ceratodon purpureus]KAG0586108.1 hypothetical protein KC19_2G064800 [Ceratodon purpureus]
MAEFDNKTCAKLEVQEGIEDGVKKLLFVKSEWNPTSFELAVSDGLRAWRFEGSEAIVNARAEAWDKGVSWVMEKLKFYLKVGQPGVAYRFTKTRDNQRKLSFDIEDKESELALTANFLMVNASDPESVTCDLLRFLHDSNARLTDSYLRKVQSLSQSFREQNALLEDDTKLKNAKTEIQNDYLKKFAAVLNSKKTKIREQQKEIERLKKENEKLREDSKSKAIDEDERDDTTSSSSEDEDDEEMSTPEKKRAEAFSERLVSEEKPFTEPASTSGVNVVNQDPEATQPFLEEVENDAPVSELPKEDPPSLPALIGDEPYKGIQRRRRRT